MANDRLAELMCRIHGIHRQLTDLKSRLDRGPRMLRAQENAMNQINGRLESVQAEYAVLMKFAKEKERMLNSSEASIARRKVQLQEAKSNKEYQALKLQIGADETANDVLASETLEAIEKAEQFSVNVDTVKEELNQSLKNQEKTKKTIEEESPVIQREIQRCLGLLTEAEKEIPIKFREPYRRLVRGMGGEQALAAVDQQHYCTGCRQLIPVNLVAQVVQGDAPITCKSCGRLLYLPEGFILK
ncbi:MAG: hypothetical protein LBQ54_09080 [Planctomycetaceae bacterium]|nr:hypothetical protein [Planctomycetaceae bacterium]